MTCTCGEEHKAGECFFVTVYRSGGQYGWLLGPYDTHEEALRNVERGRQLAHKADPWTAFDAFGTAGMQAEAIGENKISPVFGK